MNDDELSATILYNVSKAVERQRQYEYAGLLIILSRQMLDGKLPEALADRSDDQLSILFHAVLNGEPHTYLRVIDNIDSIESFARVTGVGARIGNEGRR